MSATGKSWLAAAAAPVRPEERGVLPLHTPFHFSFMRRGPGGAGAREESYSSAIKEIASFATVEHFWAVYNHILRPSSLQPPSDLFLFRHGIEPMWEDEANAAGGRLFLRVRKPATSRAFEDLALCFIGEQFDPPDLICGIACNVRFQDDVLAIWLRTAENNTPAIQAVVATARRALDLPPTVISRDWEFKPHASIPAAQPQQKQQSPASQPQAKLQSQAHPRVPPS